MQPKDRQRDRERERERERFDLGVAGGQVGRSADGRRQNRVDADRLAVVDGVLDRR